MIKETAKYVGFFLIVAILIGGATAVYKVLMAPVNVVTKTLNSDNVIANYEWFKRQFQEIKAMGPKIQNDKMVQGALESSQCSSRRRHNYYDPKI